MKTYIHSLRWFAFSVLAVGTLGVVAVSCRSDSIRLLEYAESVIAEHPDEALRVLAEVDTAGFCAVDKARTVYLRTRASAKAGLPVTWPEEMSEAAKILASQTSDSELQAMAYYYAGYACFENDRLADAVLKYRNCERILGDVPSAPLFKFVQYALFKCYYDQCLYVEAEACLWHHLHAARLQCDTADIIDVTNAIAHINMIQEKYDSAWYYYSQSQQWLTLYSHEERGAWARCYNGKSAVLCNKGLLTESLQYNDTAMLFPTDRNQYYAMCLNRGDCFRKLGMADSADYYFNLSVASNDMELKNRGYLCLYELHKMQGNDLMSTMYADSSLYYQQLLEARRQIESIKHSDERYLIDLHEEALQKEYSKFKVAIVCVLLIFAGLLGYRIWLRNRKKAQSFSFVCNRSSSIPESLITSLVNSRRMFEQTSSYSLLEELLHSEDRKFSVTEQENCRKELKEILRPVLLELKAIERGITSDDSVFLFLCYMEISFSILRRYLGMTDRAPIQRKYRLKNKMPSNLYEFFFKDNK